MKKLLLLFVGIAFCISAFSQGASCTSAIAFSNTNSSINNNNISGNEMWFSFIGDSTDIDIILEGNPDTASGHAHSMKLYQGSCVGLILIDASIVADSAIYMRETAIINGQQYYIKVVKLGGSSCRECNRSGTDFRLRLSNRNLTGSWDCNLTSCGQHIVNGDFEANVYFMDSTWPFNGWVGCWGQAYGSPQIGCGATDPAHSGTFCARMWNSDNSATTSQPHTGEGIFTFLQGSVVPGRQYIVSYWLKNDQTVLSAPTPTINVVLTKTGFAGFTADPTEDVANLGTSISITATSQVISQVSNFNNNSWQLITSCFTANDNYDILYFFPQNNQDGIRKWIEVDDFQLNEVVADAGADRTICAGSITTLGGTCPPVSGIIYSWTPAGGLADPNVANPTISPSLPPGTYVFTLQAYSLYSGSETFCIDEEDQVTVTVGEQPTITVAPSTTTICAGPNVTLSATITSPTQTGAYLWVPGGATTPTITVSPSVTTTYTCTYTVGPCSGTATATINVNTTPLFTISGSTTSCSGPAPNYTAVPVNSVPGTAYNWT
ncbi:MAG: hypothetical protein H0X46_07925, partial [Bacteroidetes bacterium]|nr:hypothetical protein [Bacteroidota bacterium]